MTIRWDGILPAITTPFSESGAVDCDFLVSHANWMLKAGCHGIVPLGSLGEGATLAADEKRTILRELVRGLPGHPVIPGISALSTHEAVALAREAENLGCAGLMVLPPYVYSTDWREMGAHMRAIIEATSLPCILYNNPVAYKTDFVPEQIAELASYKNVVAVKESSADVRRIHGIRVLIGSELNLMVGVDDIYVEAARNGAKGWIAGLVNAFPRETVKLWEWAGDPGKTAECDELYHWFLPLLRLDTVPKFVQLIKLTQQCVGMGNERVRAPRLELEGAERSTALSVIEKALDTRPELS